MDRRINLREHRSVEVGETLVDDVVAAVTTAREQLRSPLTQATRRNNSVEVKNFIGSVRMSTGSILEVEPKVPVGTEWATSVVELLETSSRMMVTGAQRSSRRNRNNDLTRAVAVEYAKRLHDALSAEGPISVYERHREVSRRLNGRLDVNAWTRRIALDPACFPVDRDELTVSNNFSHGLSVVASFFRRSTADPILRAKLRRLENMVLPGVAITRQVGPATAKLRLPSQWRKYQPAWDIASSVLRNWSVVGDPGHVIGLEVAVAPWHLLETLLKRTLKSVVDNFLPEARMPDKVSYELLTQPNPNPGEGSKVLASVIPDGVLRRHDSVLATFEAKYSNYSTLGQEAHRYQALSAAAALGSPLAVLVYPGDAPAEIFDVQGSWGTTKKFATIGLGLYSYRRQSGAVERASRLHKLLQDAGVL